MRKHHFEDPKKFLICFLSVRSCPLVKTIIMISCTRMRNVATTDMYHLSIGVYEATDDKDLYEYLSFLRSRKVFLIDWNRVRKTRNFVRF